MLRQKVLYWIADRMIRTGMWLNDKGAALDWWTWRRYRAGKSSAYLGVERWQVPVSWTPQEGGYQDREVHEEKFFGTSARFWLNLQDAHDSNTYSRVLDSGANQLILRHICTLYKDKVELLVSKTIDCH
jgi:hypothetical protein